MALAWAPWSFAKLHFREACFKRPFKIALAKALVKDLAKALSEGLAKALTKALARVHLEVV